MELLLGSAILQEGFFMFSPSSKCENAGNVEEHMQPRRGDTSRFFTSHLEIGADDRVQTAVAEYYSADFVVVSQTDKMQELTLPNTLPNIHIL